MLYYEEIKKAMSLLAEHPKSMFIGQSVRYSGTGLYNSIAHISDGKKYEFPVAENLQMGICTGLAIKGFLPIALFPRWNFLIVATDQIVNHLDKLKLMSDGEYNPKVIIRVAVGSEAPIDPQDQHKGNFSLAFRSMCKTIDILELNEPEDICPAYEYALNQSTNSTILVEFADYCKTK